MPMDSDAVFFTFVALQFRSKPDESGSLGSHVFTPKLQRNSVFFQASEAPCQFVLASELNLIEAYYC